MAEPQTAYESNPLLDRLPRHLKQFIKPQNYSDYTAVNQAVWRYVMRRNVAYLSEHAHESYLNGLNQTGISIDEIPNMYGMNRILKEIGWAAVAVDGFIPPNAFMEFQAYKVLVIASEIRQLENIEYTPAPDIIHEAAGHAPIIANPDYAEYLRRFGEIGAKAILSKHDINLYEAVRKLSILKEAPGIPQKEIDNAAAEIEALQEMDVPLSEMAQIRNLHWWTVEYGLIGALETPKIYGAGLLSSIGESVSCMGDDVKKIPYSVQAATIGFDITKPQPHLFVTPDFSHLMQVLEEFANSMSIRRKGFRGLQKLIDTDMVGTIELSTGLQVSGDFKRMILNEDREVIYFQTEGPTALAYREKELIGHGIETHTKGFSSPLGKLKGINLAIEDMGPLDLKAYNFYDGKRLSFEYESGIKVEGHNITGIRNVQGKLMLIQLDDCSITYGDEVLYRPEDGVFNMSVGKEVLASHAGAADYHSFPNLYNVSKTTTIKTDSSAAEIALEHFYQQVNAMRMSGEVDEPELLRIFKELQSEFSNDWLLATEISVHSEDPGLKLDIKNHLDEIIKRNPKLAALISGAELD